MDDKGRPVPARWSASSGGDDGRLDFATLCFLADLPEGAPSRRYHVYLAAARLAGAAAGEGIRQLAPELGDGVRRLDTGTYVLELCRGTAAGHGGSKWGIRHFEHKRQGVNLIAGNMNAFGGVYGPFFTPENGLVNPPAHMVIDVEPVVEGPVFCQYRMRGTVPDGLRPELQGKNLEIWWSFYHRSHWFVRSYFLDDYETTIDGRPCRNRITVGDEIESGKGKLLLSTYKHYQGTRYRAGDQYHKLLLDRIRDLKQREPAAVLAAMEKLGIEPGEDPASWHWDNYWRLFCVIEGALPRGVLAREVESIWRSANEIVWSDKSPQPRALHAGLYRREPHAAAIHLSARCAQDLRVWPGDRLQLRALRQPHRAAHEHHPAPRFRLGELGHQRRERISGAAVRLDHLVGLRAVRRLGSGGRQDGNAARGRHRIG